MGRERVQLNYPHKQLLILGAELQQAVDRVFGSGVFISGTESAALETEFAAWLGRTAALSTSSGSTALEAALFALGVAEGDAVAVTSNLDISAVTPIVRLGAKLSWVDLQSETVNMSAADLEARWHDQIRAVLLVHTHGYPADAGAVSAVASRHGVPLIEDITHSPGVFMAGRRVGTFGDVTVMSCAPTKPLGAVGSHGMVAADDVDLVRRAREYAAYGFEQSSLDALHAGRLGARFDYATVGINGLSEELQAAVVRLKLLHIDAWAERRREIAQRYDQVLQRVPDDVAMAVGVPTGSLPAPRSYVVRVRQRDRLAASLSSRGIATSYNYVPSLHRQRVFSSLLPVVLPVTDALDDAILGLPNAPELIDEDIEFLLAALSEELLDL